MARPTAMVFSEAKFLQLLTLMLHCLGCEGAVVRWGVRRAYCGYRAVMLETPTWHFCLTSIIECLFF